MAELDADYLETFLEFHAVPQKGPLPQKYKELIFFATNVATTHLWSSGVRRHMRNALEAGTTKEELLEVIQLTSIMGIHSMTMCVPILMEELEKFKTKSLLFNSLGESPRSRAVDNWETLIGGLGARCKQVPLLLISKKHSLLACHTPQNAEAHTVVTLPRGCARRLSSYA